MLAMTAHATRHPRHNKFPPPMRGLWFAIASVMLLAGFIGIRGSSSPAAPVVLAAPTAVEQISPGTVATLDSQPFVYSPGWEVTPQGADPGEPADPWMQPSGVVTFTYTGNDLLLQLAPGDYWGYLYVTVDGLPANQLALISGNLNQQAQPAGYRTLYAPELQAPESQTDRGTSPQWVWVHRATGGTDLPQNHTARVEIWRGWGQTPLRAVAVDAQSHPGLPRWPFVTLLVMGIGAMALTWHIPGYSRATNLLTWFTQPVGNLRPRALLALLGMLMVTGAISFRIWWLGPAGLALLSYASLRQPALWAAALLFALPFYFSQTLPILPTRATNLIDVGILGGLVVAASAWLIRHPTNHNSADNPTLYKRSIAHPLFWIMALTGWALVATSAASYGDIALREWRTVFLAATLFALLLNACRNDPSAPWLLLVAWIAGGVAIALIGLGQFATDAMLIEAEGVHRVRSLYGSPNNLALYLERTLMPTLALGLLLPNGKRRWLSLLAAALQGGVLLLTFSKGALILGLPTGLCTLWLGGLFVLRRQAASTRPLWWLAAAAAVALLALLPFLATERFQRLLDFNSGTGFTRLQLWHSSLQMALDHPGFGVGPDNFLYAYRSRYILPAAWQEPNLNHPHTWLLDWWTRLGVVGMVLGVGWWAMGLRANWQRLCNTLDTREDNQRSYAALWIGLLAASTAALSHGLIDLSYAVPDLMLVWVLLTMLPTIAPEDSPAT
jgi:O-antigen ligase